MYKQSKNLDGTINTNQIMRLSDGAYIPFAPDNVDYQQFKIEIANGVELQDANGKPITGDALTQFMKGLP
jgi:hypothetical protein